MQSIEVTFSVANLETALPYGDVDQDGNVNTNDLLDLMIEVHRRVQAWKQHMMTTSLSWPTWMERKAGYFRYLLSDAAQLHRLAQV